MFANTVQAEICKYYDQYVEKALIVSAFFVQSENETNNTNNIHQPLFVKYRNC